MANSEKLISSTAYTLGKLQPGDEIPFGLLLLADETKEAIEKYIYDSEVYIMRDADHASPVAVVALYKISETDIEIKNIAVAEDLQGRGIGGLLVKEIKKIAITARYENIIVGTPESGVKEISFYERNGFSKYAVRKDFFIENYAAPIIENGVKLRDMVMLRMKL